MALPLDLTPILVVLGLLTLPGAVVWLAARLVPARQRPSWHACGRMGICVLFILAGIGHFVAPEKFMMILPPWSPAATLVSFTGVCEIAGGVGVWIPRLRRLTGWCLIVFLACITPANVYAAMNAIDVGGHGAGPVYLWVRLPLQGFIMGWVYWFAAKPGLPLSASAAIKSQREVPSHEPAVAPGWDLPQS